MLGPLNPGRLPITDRAYLVIGATSCALGLVVTACCSSGDWRADDDGIGVRPRVDTDGLQAYQALRSWLSSPDDPKVGIIAGCGTHLRTSVMNLRCHIHDIGGGFTIEEAAYHEAGHSVASVYLNLPFDYVSVDRQGGHARSDRACHSDVPTAIRRRNANGHSRD